MTTIRMFEDSIMQITMDESWFDMASLVAIASCNNQLHALVDCADHLWEPILGEIKFPQTGFVDDTKWKSPDIPPSYPPSRVALRLPPRINGGRREDDSFFVHPSDYEARGRGLVLAKESGGSTSFDQTTGILNDRFHDENEGSSSSYTFIPRGLPIECKACRVMLDSYPALVAHCKQWSHRQNMDEARGRRVPDEFVDPRNTESYHQLPSVFRKVMALKTFEYKYTTFLRAPLDQAGIDGMLRLRQLAVSNIPDMYRFERPPTIPLEQVREACIAILLGEFYEKGIDSNNSLDVVLGGWQAFSPLLTHRLYLTFARLGCGFD